ncbi:SDR family oxidoreductase [Bacillaceae bacterium Marseille-Q3522]|nr:SDR family oxidoreductase [Bacillaceae bacterium Marseille-Q3522]
MLTDSKRRGEKRLVNRLKDKNIIITGASGGIGYAIAEQCAERGANLVLMARREDKLLAMKKAFAQRYSGEIIVRKLDVADTNQIVEIFSGVLTELGHIDILVNNAGFGIFQAAADVELTDVQEMMDVNVVGLIACTRMVLPFMEKQRSGHIINIASQAGKIATPKSSVYAASKHAVLGFTNSLRMEMAEKNVYVTAVNPGPIATDFFNRADKSGNYVKNIKNFMLQPEYVAKKVVNVMLIKKREVNLPWWMNTGSMLYTLFPRLFERVARQAFNKK